MSWTATATGRFSTIFKENYFLSKPFHGGFEIMTLHGVPKPIYRAFEMLRMLGARHVEVVDELTNVEVWVSLAADALAPTPVVVIKQAMPRHPGGPERITLRLSHPTAQFPHRVSLFRVDAAYADPQKTL